MEWNRRIRSNKCTKRNTRVWTLGIAATALSMVLSAPSNVMAQDPCVVQDNGTGTVTLPPEGCEYLSPDEFHVIIDGLPPGTEIILQPIHKDFICKQGLPQEFCNFPGGNLGGEVETFNSTAEFQATGTGALAGFNRLITLPNIFSEVHTGPRNPGDPVQTFPNEMVQLQGNLPPGDPDFNQLQILVGQVFGLPPSPGNTTLTRLGPPGSDFQVDSFFDITYQIDFQGAPGGALDGLGGSTVGTVRMDAFGVPQICPLPPTAPWCIDNQQFDCDTGTDTDTCLPLSVSHEPGIGVVVNECACFAPGADCGAVDITPDGQLLRCPGPCPIPPGGACEIHFDGNSIGAPDVPITAVPPGVVVTCDCPQPPPDDHVTIAPTIVRFGVGPAIPPIPADFFGPGSEPFFGEVSMTGPSPNAPSVRLQRDADPVLPGDPVNTSGTVQIEIVALDLVSAEPIPVQFNSGDVELWNLRVSNIGSSGKDGVAPGQLTATKTHPNGGTYDADFFMCPVITFTRASDGQVATLDLCPQPTSIPLHFLISGFFVHNVDPALNVIVDPASQWEPGIEHEDIGQAQQIVPSTALTDDAPPSVSHTVVPPVVVCPLPAPPITPWCQNNQTFDCDTGTADDRCLPRVVSFEPGVGIIVNQCDCFPSGPGCGPVDISNDGTLFRCPGVCPNPPGGNCEIHLDGISTGQSDFPVSAVPPGVSVTCDCGPVVDVCEPDPTGTGCTNAICPDPTTEACQARCVNFDPATGVSTVTDCNCIGQQDCHIVIPGPAGQPCPGGTSAVMGPNGCVATPVGGTVELPPPGCSYLSPEDVHEIIDGLPPGTTIELGAEHTKFMVQNSGPGGTLGGEFEQFDSILLLDVCGTGALGGFSRTLGIPVQCETHIGPRVPGDPVQDFDTDMFLLQGELFGDPDFCNFKVTGGTGNGLPSPGHTTLTQLPSGNFQVDSFFDITYQIEFQGCPGSALEGFAGTTEATIRMSTGGAPFCEGACPAGQTCVENQTVLADGTIDICCDCIDEPVTGACCIGPPAEACLITTAADCAEFGGIYLGDNSVCLGIEACCLPSGACTDIDRACCTAIGGTAQGPGTTCNDVVCDPGVCEPNATGTDCTQPICPDDPGGIVQECLKKCVKIDPLTGALTVTECDCIGLDDCHVEILGATPGTPLAGGGDPCVVPDNGNGTVTLPPVGCEYLSPDEVHMIIDGLPAGTTIELEPIHRDFICQKTQGMCTFPLPPGECEAPGGNLGGNQDCFNSVLELNVQGVGPPLDGFNRTLFVPILTEVHTGPRNPGDPVQDFDTEMVQLQGELFGDPDFCTFRMTGGSNNGLPSPGHTTLTRLPSGDFYVDSFFDITYQIEFQGCPGSVLEGMAGTTTGTIKMVTGGKPVCVGGCPDGQECIETTVIDAAGQITTCCDCQDIVTGACCIDTAIPGAICVVTTQTDCEAQGGVYVGDNSVCQGVEACCLPTGACIDIDRTCCELQGGTPQGAVSDCSTTDCPLPVCEPRADGLACEPVVCPDDGTGNVDECLAKCAVFDPLTGAVTITDCDCTGVDECHLEIFTPGTGGTTVAGGGGDPCVVPPGPPGTVTLPPAGCEYLSADEVHMIIDGLPAGTTIELAPIHKDFICQKGAGTCSLPIPPGECETAGGNLGGQLDCFGSNLELQVTGNGPPLDGFSRNLNVFIFSEVHTAPRNPGDPVQTFDTDFFRIEGELFGDPDFCTFRVRGGTDFGLPSPGQTTLTQLPSGNFQVDSFFDITYEIEFQGCPGSILEGFGGTTQGTVRMVTGGKPKCVGGCPPGEVCIDTTVVNADGTLTVCCDCVAAEEACCLQDGTCIQTTAADCAAQGGTPQGAGSVCLGIEACCRADGTCSMEDALCCEASGGIPQGAGSTCTSTGPEACCIAVPPPNPGFACVDADPVCCDDIGGIPAGPGTACDGLEGACCFDADGDGIDESCVVMAEPCCGLLNGTFNGPGSVCQGDGNGNGIDDACEPFCPLPPQPIVPVCENNQSTQCVDGGPNDLCLPLVLFTQGSGVPPFAELCDCVEPGTCGPVLVQPIPGGPEFEMSCLGQCPPGEECLIHLDGVSSGFPTTTTGIVPPGVMVTCQCDSGCPPAVRPNPENKLGQTCTSDADCSNLSVCIFGDCYVPKNKYISLRPKNAGQAVALQVTMVGNGLFPGLVGSVWWVQPHAAGDPPEVFRLGCAKHYQDWSTAPAVLQIADRHITPQADYEIRAIAFGCDQTIPSNFSDPLRLPTVDTWGDCCGAVQAGATQPPDGNANLIDVFAAIQTFQNAASAPNDSWVDIDGDVPNAVVNLADALRFIQAFQVNPYPYPGPVPCP